MTEEKKRPFRRLAVRASAELGVIILGVTLALWTDGWVARRNDRAVESARLRSLSENIERSLIALRAEKEDADSAGAALRRLASGNPGWSSEEARTALLRGFLYVTVFRPELNVYEDLKNSGELSLLRDAELRRSLSALDGRLQQLQLLQEDMITVQQLNLDPYLIRRIDLLPVLGVSLAVGNGTDVQLRDLTFLTEPEFRNLVLFKLDLVELMRGEIAEVEEALLAAEHAISAQVRRTG